MREEELPKKLMAILVLMVLGITLPSAADAVQPPDSGTKSGTSYPVYVEIPVGDPLVGVTIAKFGPLEFFARCFLSDGTGPAAVVALDLESRVDDWLTVEDATLRPANTLDDQESFSGESKLVKPIDVGAMAVATGHYLRFFGVVASPGMNIQNACVVAGQIDTAELPKPAFGRSGGYARRSGAGDNPESSEPIADIGHESSPAVGALPVMWTWP